MKALQAHTCVNLDGRPMGRVRRTYGAFLYPLKMNEISSGSYICTGYVNTPIYIHIHIHTQARIQSHKRPGTFVIGIGFQIKLSLSLSLIASFSFPIGHKF